MKGNHRQLILREPIGIITAKNVLQSLIRSGVVHHLAVVLDEDPIITLPEVTDIDLEHLP